ncbi:hypothetical protein M431DRAFT_494610 [Trichoderma harzianum CBS 226.95]|uniref:Uncharacterized protein n=1 Tax=Trichoderma harzianum CBS 226.95 TaxID=983964 RepID=A0A2T4AGG1_TRIHA|nr:hypothetical protein M431DRAFT_494610 [Trichoderma harzianum CBS 226.95]PTB56175.1 hypothetical protein M431DRAFT_494610 [Trichoderma harzianum CBS 226.95]
MTPVLQYEYLLVLGRGIVVPLLLCCSHMHPHIASPDYHAFCVMRQRQMTASLIRMPSLSFPLAAPLMECH